MSSRLLYEGVLIELNKENAPNILLEDFNYFANKAVNNYVNKRYNIYDVNQQTTDDLRVLKATAVLTPEHIDDNGVYSGLGGLTMAGENKMATYEVIMPSDYLHILNCICIYKVKRTYKCYNAGDHWRAAATRLTADMYSQVLDNFWNKPTYKRPYYYIHNVNTNSTVPTNPYSENPNADGDSNFVIPNAESSAGTPDAFGLHEYEDYDFCMKETSYEVVGNKIYKVINYKLYLPSNDRTGDPDLTVEDRTLFYTLSEGSTAGTDVNTENSSPNGENYGTDGLEKNIVNGNKIFNTVNIGGEPVSNRERGQGIRYGNASLVRLEIRFGTDTSVFELEKVYVDYIKAPQYIRLTQQEIDLTEDTSQMLEYPDYVCQEIINELVHLIMENISDLRLSTHPVVSQSIANPTQALTPQAALGQAAQ